MIFPRSLAITLAQRWLIIGLVIVSFTVFGAFIYTYERDHRGPTESVFYGTWEMESGCIDCKAFISFSPNHYVIAFSDYSGNEELTDSFGRWYAGGNLLVIHYNTSEQSWSTVMKILDIAPDTIRLRSAGTEVVWRRSARAVPQYARQAIQATTRPRPVDADFYEPHW